MLQVYNITQQLNTTK